MGHYTFFSIDKNACISFGFWISWICSCLPNVLFYGCIIAVDALQFSYIFWSGRDIEVSNVKITINSKCKTPCNTVNFYIKQCYWQNTPLRDSLFLFVEIRKCWSDLNSELPVREKTFYKVQQSSSQSKAMEIFHYSKLPSGLINLIQIKEDCYQMLFLDISLSYGGFPFNHMIHCWSAFSEATLRVGNKFIRFKIPDQSFVYHVLRCFTQATS